MGANRHHLHHRLLLLRDPRLGGHVHLVFVETGMGTGPPEKFFTGDFLHADTTSLTSTNVVWPIAIVLALVWAAITAVMVLGVRKGTGLLSSIFVPLLIIMFIILVIRALFLPGAAEGLEAFFTPQWGALLDPQVWIAAYGQIFYSLAIAFGIMMTQASYCLLYTSDAADE